MNLRVTMLEDASWFVPFVETWTKTKLPWATTPAVHRYAEFPPMEEYGRLSAEFSEIAELRKRLRNAIIARDRADFHSLRHAERVVFAVQGDPDEGSDGLLYAEMGYVRHSARRRRRRQKT